ncbi:MAG: Aspartyl-tRNA synthetase [Candidatus Uhrbacteria bacterium GW2011_GWE2_40_58]|nr:MAG: Aspartyl-tRNA synthetase [Candidatus Uhrbacteria bacterium GW2011_GWF2_40_263]KKR66879.1 MAG: Aspartyl-tRNA synthetase [Candidatus Uhrbacteria bacterium GW2011_GWE2_40_58]OGL93827.1 MAG: aspartate--tRNA(Asn) ligase [Candidatus Uhrbacteria bacterium RIFOXYA2_FULL_40_9]OGL97981.1 MAG: aspartate--tRNA(Asn) ligase [Candidatus Uhrbacteria bacterium RIFOXYB2_FULL_41_18]HBK35245.1 aspartate--tRNA(Asn) ligase [Candidatus Uhrbacteria bacterium]
MNRILTSEVINHIGEEVQIAGWLHRLRNLNKFGFAILRDRSGMLQVVLTEQQLAQLQEMQMETVLRVTGKVVEKQTKDPSKKEAEIQATEVEILSPVLDVLPVEINKPEIEAQLETVLDNRVVTLRHPKQQAIFRVQAALVRGFREYMQTQGFTEILFPILAGAASEGGAEFFKVDYYGREATLTQSAQLYKQIMMGVYEGVYGVSYSFRAEKFATSRHLTEFNQLEFEVGFVSGMGEIMDYTEETTRKMLKVVQSDCQADLDLLNVTLPPLGEKFPRIKLTEALEIYKQGTGIDETTEPDLSPAAEKWLSTVWAPKEFGSGFVFVTHYPEKKRPFYTMLDPEDSTSTLSFDLIGFGSEIVSGGMRVNRYDEQIERIKSKGLNPEDFADYLMMHKFGIPPEGGFGMGVQRLTQNVLGLENIKEATLFPRDVQRLRP